MPQVYDGGQPCDITGQARATEVRFVCAPDARDAILSIAEAATCRYALVFATPRLCALPAFATPEPPVHRILCGAAGGEPAAGVLSQGVGAGAAGGNDGHAAGEGGAAVQQGTGAGGEGQGAGEEEAWGLGEEEEEGGEKGAAGGEERGQGRGGPSLEDAAELRQNGSVTEGRSRDAHAGSPEGEDEAQAEGDGEGEHAVVGSKGSPTAVGPPMPPAEAAVADPDSATDDEEEDDEVEFIRTGMYAEL